MYFSTVLYYTCNARTYLIQAVDACMYMYIIPKNVSRIVLARIRTYRLNHRTTHESLSSLGQPFKHSMVSPSKSHFISLHVAQNFGPTLKHRSEATTLHMHSAMDIGIGQSVDIIWATTAIALEISPRERCTPQLARMMKAFSNAGHDRWIKQP